MAQWFRHLLDCGAAGHSLVVKHSLIVQLVIGSISPGGLLELVSP